MLGEPRLLRCSEGSADATWLPVPAGARGPAQGPAGRSRPGPRGPAACAPDKQRPGRSSAAMAALGSSPPSPGGKPAGAPSGGAGGLGLTSPLPGARASLAGSRGRWGSPGGVRVGVENLKSGPGRGVRDSAPSAPSAPCHAGGPLRAFAGQKGHGPPGGSSERAPVAVPAWPIIWAGACQGGPRA
jgi:hypothetical protein